MPPTVPNTPHHSVFHHHANTGEQLGLLLMRGVTYSVVLVVGFILLDIVVKGVPALSWAFLLEMPSDSGAAGGILPAILGTLCLMGIALGMALPLSLLTAIYLSEYAPKNALTEGIRLAILTLAGVPSIVYGLFGLAVFVLVLQFGTSMLAGGLTLGLMILPIMIVASEESLKAVPTTYREASLALGATPWQTIVHQMLPVAFPGVLTGAILGMGRAAGETAPILLTAAAFYLPFLPGSPFDQVMALPYHLFILATQHPDAEAVRPMQYGTALVLMVMVATLALSAAAIRSHFRKKWI